MPTRSSACCTFCFRSAALVPRYVNGSSTFSYTVKSPIKLNAWKINPISRLRIRVRSLIERFATGCPLSVYSPPVGESSSPRIESNVDLPQPEGPAIEMYCPFLISR